MLDAFAFPLVSCQIIMTRRSSQTFYKSTTCPPRKLYLWYKYLLVLLPTNGIEKRKLMKAIQAIS